MRLLKSQLYAHCFKHLLHNFGRFSRNKSSILSNAFSMKIVLSFIIAISCFKTKIYAQWRKATVQLNYHIALDYQNYSVPYEFVRKQVDVRLTSNMVEIYYEGRRIASHKRILGCRGQYVTVTEHMPVNHQLYSYRAEEQAYKGCLSLLKLADTYGTQRLNAACGIALQQVPIPRYKLIHNILVTKQDQPFEKPPIAASDANAFVRGAAYYGGNHHGE